MNADLLGLAEPIWAAEHGASVVGIKRKGGYVTRYVGIEGTATEFQRGVPYWVFQRGDVNGGRCVTAVGDTRDGVER